MNQGNSQEGRGRTNPRRRDQRPVETGFFMSHNESKIVELIGENERPSRASGRGGRGRGERSGRGGRGRGRGQGNGRGGEFDGDHNEERVSHNGRRNRNRGPRGNHRQTGSDTADTNNYNIDDSNPLTFDHEWKREFDNCMRLSENNPSVAVSRLSALVQALQQLRDETGGYEGFLTRAPPAFAVHPPAPEIAHQSHRQQGRTNHNPFGNLQQDDEDDQLPVPPARRILSPPARTQQTNTAPAPARPRILLFWYLEFTTYLGELYPLPLRRNRNSRDWMNGLETFQKSLELMRSALVLADSSLVNAQVDLAETPDRSSTAAVTLLAKIAELEKAADAIHVATVQGSRDVDQYKQVGENRLYRLREILQPQWADRDAVKSRWGEERWKNNPNPSGDYAAMRREAERELHELEGVLAALDLIAQGYLETGVLSFALKASCQDALGGR